MSAEPVQAPAPRCDHTVRFYQSDARLCEAVGAYLHGGLERGEAVVAIATDEHRRGFTRVLAARGASVDDAVARGQLAWLDAEETLHQLMVGGLANGRPDPIAFRRVIGDVVEQARDEGRRDVRAYGEMVSILLRLGNETATTRLEELWNELALTHPFQLYCAYGLGQFDLARHRDLFEAICAQHSHVFPGESYDEETPSAEQSRQIAALQQRAQALEAEIAERRRVESVLRLVCEASAALGGSLDYNEALARVALLAVGEIADWCAVDLVDADGGLRRLASASRDESGQAVLDPPLLIDANRDSHGPWRVLETGQSEVGSAASDPALRRLGMKSSLCAALKANGRVHGVLTLATADATRRYGPADMLLVEDLAGRAAVAIETARLCDELRRADRRKDEFLATLSHELRSPLNAIVGWTHLLRTGSLDANGSRRALETIARNATAQNRLIGDILDMQRLASGKLRLTLSAIDVAAVVESAVDTVRPAAQAKGIELVARVEREGEPVLGDADRLQQVVWNLLSNAVKFTPAGRVEIRQTTSGSHVEITVEDDGPGIAPDFLPYVFDRFRQADASATRRHGGLGLGLAIARTLVELHGGTIEASNRQPVGARFRVRLPYGPGPDSTRVSVRPGTEGQAASSHVLHGTKVLVVDDDVEAREVVAGILSQRGAEVFVATSGSDALPLLRRERPHVLICDIEMPEEDGYNLLRKVRALPAREGGAVPAVALTGHARPEDSLRALNAGFQAHVAKPTHPEGLIAIVARLADKHR
jgi:signal transduction histidine kinase/ActR/RegA family two-component response regulator